jgi:DNA repair protein RecO (recombination protein O)
VTAIETPALVVRAVDYGESDRILTLLCRSLGKVAAIARGARKSQRRFGASLGLYALGQARLRERRGAQLAALESWQLIADHGGLALDVARVAHAAYVCEVARDLQAAHDAAPEVFDLTIETLSVLAESDRPPRVETLRVFEVRLLDALGIGPVLDRCAACGSLELAQGGLRFDLARGGVVCGGCAAVGPELSEPARQALLFARRLRPAAAAEGLRLDRATNAACRDALLSAICHQLGRPLRSVEFIAKVQNA